MATKAKKSIGSTVFRTADPDQCNLFGNINIQTITGVRVFNVGQGDAIGLLDENGDIALYIDYGGLLDHPDKSNNFQNTAKRLSPKHGNHNVGVILTHWDYDHYYSATKVREIQHGQWIVPRQMVGPLALAFSANLSNAYCWPEIVLNQAFIFSTNNGDEVIIEKLAPTIEDPYSTQDRNLSGLAISVVRNPPGDQEEDSDNEITSTLALLPGDAPYNKIAHFPSLKTACEFKGYVAYHHGAVSHWSGKTDAALGTGSQNSITVFSYGMSNRYNHPHRNKYAALNWNNQHETPAQKYIDIPL